MAWRTKVTDPKDEISFTILESRIKSSHLGRSMDFFERKKYPQKVSSEAEAETKAEAEKTEAEAEESDSSASKRGSCSTNCGTRKTQRPGRR